MKQEGLAAVDLSSQEFQEALRQSLGDVLKTLPAPQAPSWLETTFEFIKAYPWTAFWLALLFIVLVSILIREMICSYFKTNEILARLKRLEGETRG